MIEIIATIQVNKQLTFNVTNEILVVLKNGSNYEYHFITKELPKKFECLGENTDMYKTISVPILKKNKKLIKIAIKLL